MEILPAEFMQEFTALKNKVQRLEKAFRKLKKDMSPASEKKPREPSGFAKPTYLSPALCDFLGISAGSELARTEVTKRVLQYVKDNNLQNPEHKREILIDDKLKKLLAPEDGESVTYFSIQRLLKVHYVKNDAEAAPAPPATPATPAKASAKASTKATASKTKTTKK
jgi:chromatin remodeling complex protein RSC6